jgi:geranylgeranyl reductase family protein
MFTVKRYDVAIIGAGPAGAYLAWLLAREGLGVLILDKKNFPRYKPCGGGLTPRAVKLLPFDISPVVEALAYRVKVGVSGKILFDYSFPDPIVTLVMRDTFDDLMIEQARHAGAVFKPGTTFQGVQGPADGLQVETSRGNFYARMVVGADGVNSRVARALRLTAGGRYMTAVESELYPKRRRTLSPYRGKVDFDFGLVPRGYGWIFPKKNHLSVGVLTLSRKVRSMKEMYYRYLAARGLLKDTEVKRFQGALIRCGSPRQGRFANSRGLLIGDAAGLADPITGEGIFACLQHARLAADVIGAYVGRRLASIIRYDQLMRERFHTELTCAGRMSDFFYRFPRLSRAVLQVKAPGILENFIRIVQGHDTYEHHFNPRTLAAKLCFLPFAMLKNRRHT